MKTLTFTKACCLLFLAWGSANATVSAPIEQSVNPQSVSDSAPDAEEQKYFTNPIRPYGADPWVIQADGKYYFSESNGIGRIVLHEFTKLSDLAKPEKSQEVYESSHSSLKIGDVWGPHINKINGEWYIYFCGHTSNYSGTGYQRMWVLKSTTDSPFGPYRNMGEVLNSGNRDWAIDGSVLQRANGDLYFVWSGISKEDIANGSWAQRSYIAKMISPTRIDRKTITVISSPTNHWEVTWAKIQEGQRPLYVDKNGKTIIMFSANGSWGNDYCLGSLTNTDGDFLNPKSWKKSHRPLFQRDGDVYSPGGASYVKSPDGTENWIIYHAQQRPGSGWTRNIRMQPFTFDKDNNPIFGKPIQAGVKIPVPSGDYPATGIVRPTLEQENSSDLGFYDFMGRKIEHITKSGLYVNNKGQKIYVK